jgi:F-box-like
LIFWWVKKMSVAPVTSIADLPNEILFEILAGLEFCKKLGARLVCRRWEAVVSEMILKSAGAADEVGDYSSLWTDFTVANFRRLAEKYRDDPSGIPLADMVICIIAHNDVPYGVMTWELFGFWYKNRGACINVGVILDYLFRANRPQLGLSEFILRYVGSGAPVGLSSEARELFKITRVDDQLYTWAKKVGAHKDVRVVSFLMSCYNFIDDHSYEAGLVRRGFYAGAIEAGNVEVVKWTLNKIGEDNATWILELALELKRLEIARMCYDLIIDKRPQDVASLLFLDDGRFTNSILCAMIHKVLLKKPRVTFDEFVRYREKINGARDSSWDEAGN